MPPGRGRITGDGRGLLRVASIRVGMEAADKRATARRSAGSGKGGR
jgi:hypothetical protein